MDWWQLLLSRQTAHRLLALGVCQLSTQAAKSTRRALTRACTHPQTLPTVQIATPGLRLVLDPMLYLDAQAAAGQLQGGGVPKLIHMTMANKHRVAPHQVGGLVLCGWVHVRSRAWSLEPAQQQVARMLTRPTALLAALAA